MNEKRKFISLFSLFLVLVTILVIMLGLTNSHDPTSTRYIKREKDELRAYYSALYFDATGEGSGIVLENNEGYVNLDLKNYIKDDVTKRDIEYEIKTVDTYYDADGNVIADPATYLDGTNDLYVLDLWNQPTKIERDTCKYAVNVEATDGEVMKDEQGHDIIDEQGHKRYVFRYEERGSSAVGKTHRVSLKVQRTSTDTFTGMERISVVVQIIKPYSTIYIINMYVSDRLIMFSDMDVDLFETPFKTLQIQTANAFRYAYKENTAGTAGTTGPTDISQTCKTAKAFKVTLSWENLMLNEGLLKRTVHNNYSNLLLTSEPSNIDVSKPYFSLADLKQPDAGSGQIYKGSLVIYVPQSANFDLYFVPTNSNYSIKAKVEIWHEDKENASNIGYKYYTLEEFGGYEFDPTSGYMTVMSSPTSEGGNVNG